MAKEMSDDQIVEQLKQTLARQDALREQFEAGHPADEYKEEIGLGEDYRAETEFRMDKDFFLVQHVPTKTLEAWSVMNRPRLLRARIEEWVDQIHDEAG